MTLDGIEGSVESSLMLKCKNQCHCACSSEIGICIIIDDGRQAAHKKTTKIHALYSCFECKYSLSVSTKKKKKLPNSTTLIFHQVF